MGIDVGSTTAKVVIIDEYGSILWSEYARHNADIPATLSVFLNNLKKHVGETEISLAVTGSAGLGLSERCNLPFVQEVVAASYVVQTFHPSVLSMIDIGGEDAKIVLFSETGSLDMRMNSNCAGGTGSFIDQIAGLLHVTVSELDALAEKHSAIYPIASRCGVFAKTDVQNLLSREISKPDIAASVFHAVALQTINSLAKGSDIRPHVLFSGGPLTFLPSLRKAFCEILKLSENSIILPNRGELLAAVGVALSPEKQRHLALSELIGIISTSNLQTTSNIFLSRLFDSRMQYEEWKSAKTRSTIDTVSPENSEVDQIFLGIDSGSTTIKIVAIDARARIVSSFYSNNNDGPIDVVCTGLRQIRESLQQADRPLPIIRSAVTGYGEDLIRTAFSIDDGVVETIAHYRAARTFDPDVSFILDIGGQDMKAIFVRNGIVNNIELNEACSSGCGTFIDTFANSLGYTVADFANAAVDSTSPSDLGVRCTVFMNSRVKQMQREGAGIPDISAGLAYSVIKNCFNKVLKIRDRSILGDHIVVQGGTFKNDSVLRAMEIILGKEVIRSNIPELMGAYGAALYARDKYRTLHESSTFIGLDNVASASKYERRFFNCKGCENTCRVTRMTFKNEQTLLSGNRCEKIHSNRGSKHLRGQNGYAMKLKLLFDRPMSPIGAPKLRIGIPRILNMYENFPFWCTLFTEVGFEVVLSPVSTMKLYEKGSGTVMSENICFPAKLAHGHIIDLIEQKVDRIFYPMVSYEHCEFHDAHETFNCPVVTGYPDVIKSSIDPTGKYGIPFDKPAITFKDASLLKKAVTSYLMRLGIPESSIDVAFSRASESQELYRRQSRELALSILKKSKEARNLTIILAGRPYHLDPLINHKIPEMITEFGADVITTDVVFEDKSATMGEVYVLSQYSYPNRLFAASRWTAATPSAEMIQLNSFGCGPDAYSVDEVKEILGTAGKNHTLIRIDEMTSQGSVKLRIRSLIESLRLRSGADLCLVPRRTTPAFTLEEQHRKILVPYFSEYYSTYVSTCFGVSGHHLEILPPPDRESVEIGLKYVNNDICYPATIIIGDILKALQSGKHDLANIAVGISQTAGQCRATGYLSILKKALIAAGYGDIPVVGISIAGRSLNYQPGFSLDRNKLILVAFLRILVSDCLSSMYHATAIREKHKGESRALLEKYFSKTNAMHGLMMIKQTFSIIREAVADFNRIEIENQNYPKAVIIGEIYAKYNPFGNYGAVEWLMSQGIEVIVPPLAEFFAMDLVSAEANRELHIENLSLSDRAIFYGLNSFINSLIRRANRVMKEFTRFRPFHTINHVAKSAANVCSLTNQYGEGWLIPGEVSCYSTDGVKNILCVQPFGCIANHVVARGLEKRMRDLHPDLNLLFVDMDAGSSEANVINRLHFFARNAKTNNRSVPKPQTNVEIELPRVTFRPDPEVIPFDATTL
jgi:predicted CoA-substrate-specific enzyme activase